MSRLVGRTAYQLRAAALSLIVLCPLPAQSETAPKIVITVHTIKPLDRFDELSLGDLYARATLGGKSVTTDVLKQTSKPGQIIAPGWTLSEAVSPGEVDVKFELIDKDLAEDDVIDINRLDNRRVLEFKVDTKRCRITGFANDYKCKAKIPRTGKEKKAAEIVFSVDVKK